ncbi:MAG: outer membrane beta-barrel protein [Saprospiraceae bacterium]
MKKRVFLPKSGILVAAFLLSRFIIGAQVFTLTGMVTDLQKNALPGNALLLDSNGEQLVRGVFFENGAFALSADSAGSYLLRVTSLGFSDADIPVTISAGTPAIDVGEIALKESPALLGEVTVSARKKMFEKTPDGTRLNVQNTMLGKSANAVEMLTKTPGVTIASGRVNVFGRGEAAIYLNGKEIPFGAFRSLPPGQIHAIEIITNPSAKYDARAKAVILVTMKSSYHSGLLATLSESITAGFVPNAPFGEHFMNNASLNLDLKKDPLSFTAYFANDYGTKWNENRYSTQLTAPGGLYNTNYYYRENATSKNVHYYRLGAGYQVNDRSDISFQYDGLSHFFTLDVAQDGDYFSPTQQLTLIRMQNAATTALDNHSGNLNYSLRLDTLGGSLFAGVQYNDFENQLLDNIAETISRSETDVSKSYKINDGYNRIRLTTAQVDVTKFLPGGIKSEFGAKYYTITNEGRIRFLTRAEGDGSFVENPALANGNRYKETVPAAYALFSGTLSKWTYNVGLRAEHTTVNAFSQKLNQTIVDSAYFNLFPSAKVNVELNENWSTGLSFARKINRPVYQNLDPFLWYLDSLTSIQGNPRLTPEFLSQLEWSLTHKNYTLKFGYTHSQNTLWAVAKPGISGENSVVFVQDNIQNRRIFFAALDLPVETGQYSSYTILRGNFFRFADDRSTYATRASRAQLYVYSYHQFAIPKWFNLDVTGEYFGAMSDGFTDWKPNFYLTMGASRTFFGDRLDVQLQFNDLFFTARFKGNRTINTITSDFHQRFLSQYLRLTAVWKIGGINNFRYKNKAINEKEFNRIKQ